jgi:hypothetical protein
LTTDQLPVPPVPSQYCQQCPILLSQAIFTPVLQAVELYSLNEEVAAEAAQANVETEVSAAKSSPVLGSHFSFCRDPAPGKTLGGILTVTFST